MNTKHAESQKCVYLCGGINGLSDSECTDWREYAKKHLKFPTLDPMRRDYRGREMEPGIDKDIVRGDLEDIQQCSFVLANHPRPSTGTDMEIFAAHLMYKKSVVTVVPPDCVPSPWLTVNCTLLVRSLDAAINWINGFAK